MADRPGGTSSGAGLAATAGVVVIERRAVRRRRPLTEGDLSWIRSTARWKRLVDEICVPGAVCGICLGERGPILFDVRRAHPLSRSLDHIKPLARGGDPWDPANLQPAHLSCNAAKGDREPPARCNRGWSWY